MAVVLPRRVATAASKRSTCSRSAATRYIHRQADSDFRSPGLEKMPMTGRPGLLSKERIVAAPGFNRWLLPPAALAIHLCIGMAYGFSVFWLPLSKAIGIDHAVECPASTGFLARAFLLHLRLEGLRSRLDVHVVLRVFRLVRGAVGGLAGTRWPAASGCHLGAVLVRWTGHFRDRSPCAPAVDDVDWLRSHRRHRPRPRLHFARVDVD